VADLLAGTRRTALETSLRALHHRDLSTAQLERRLEDRGYDERERSDALATLLRTGLLDDERFAVARATSLAARGAGNALIRDDLERAGVPRELADAAVGSLEDESVRARRIVERRGPGPKTARYLGGKGFADEAIAACAGSVSAGGVSEG
jgi:regulatory protein